MARARHLIEAETSPSKARAFIMGSTPPRIEWLPDMQTFRDRRTGMAFRWRFDAPKSGIVLFVNNEGSGHYSASYVRRGEPEASIKVNDSYVWSASTISEAFLIAKELVQTQLFGKKTVKSALVREAVSPKEFFRQMGPWEELKRLSRYYRHVTFHKTADRLDGLLALKDHGFPRVVRHAVESWIKELEPYEHRPGHDLGQRLLRVLRRTLAAMPETSMPVEQVKEGSAKDFIKSVSVYGPAFERFYRAYVEAALWSSDDDFGTPLDQGEAELSYDAEQQMKTDCVQFYMQAQNLIGTELVRAGHDFWLTRNRHGAGFWDGDWDEVGDELTKIARSFGEAYLYVGDDGMIHHQ